MTIGCRYNPQATKGLRIHVRSSRDGTNYEKVAVQMFNHELHAGQKVLRTFDLDGRAPYVKILVENPDPTQSAAEVSVTAKIQG